MSRYLSILTTDIREFVTNNCYKNVVEMQDYARRREIELEIQTKENMQTLAPSQPATKKFKSIGSRFRGRKGCTCSKCSKFHDGPCRTGPGPGCHKYGKEGLEVP